MLGLPICTEIEPDENAVSILLGEQAIEFHRIRDYVFTMEEKGFAIGYSEGFLRYIGLTPSADTPVIAPGIGNCNLIEMSEAKLNALRDILMAPLGVALRALTRVALNLYDDDMKVLQNFNDFDVDIELNLLGCAPHSRSVSLVLSADKAVGFRREHRRFSIHLPARTLVVLS